MSLSCSECFSDLLCDEDSNTIFSDYGDELPQHSSDLESRPPEVEEYIPGLLEDERDLTELNIHQLVDPSVRAESIAWILKVQRYYGFQPLTAYLSVNYFDRFLHSKKLPQKLNGWPLQLLSIACLSLAAKMEEPLVPSLLDLQVKGAQIFFESRNIQRMELLVLRVLDWRLRSISPFCYLSFFALKIKAGTYTGFLISRAKEIILCCIQETSFLEYRPSCIAAATILCAANDLPDLSSVTAQHAESWCDGLHKEKLMPCYQLMRRIVSKNKQPKVLPRFRVTTCSSIHSCNSSSFSSSCKRRKLNGNSWADDNEG